MLGFLAAAALLAVRPAAGEHAPAPTGAPAIGATVKELLDYAEAHNPELAVARFEVQAAEARVQPAGAFDDPMLEVELKDMDRSLNRIGSVKYMFTQPLPFFGKRDLRTEVAQAGVKAAEGQERATAADIRERIKVLFAQSFQVQEAARLNHEILGILQDLERITEVRYASGLAPQQDFIKSQVEQTAIRNELITLETEAVHIRSRLNSLLSRPAGAALADPQALRPAPAAASLDIAALESRLRAASPLLFTQEAQVAASEASRQLVERNRYPDFSVGFGPIQADDRLAAWEAKVTMNIPLQQESRRSREREALANLDAARARRDAIASRLLNDLHEAFASWEAARRKEGLIERALLPQATVNYQSALAGYEAGKVDFATLLEAERQVKAARLEHLRARVEQEARIAQIERMIGGEL
ncbi:MAG TPA: TolC family protein [Burkholderiales bacterium]|nr:TolC family protein [Burkholderiales bacterium]